MATSKPALRSSWRLGVGARLLLGPSRPAPSSTAEPWQPPTSAPFLGWVPAALPGSRGSPAGGWKSLEQASAALAQGRGASLLTWLGQALGVLRRRQEGSEKPEDSTPHPVCVRASAGLLAQLWGWPAGRLPPWLHSPQWGPGPLAKAGAGLWGCGVSLGERAVAQVSRTRSLLGS